MSVYITIVKIKKLDAKVASIVKEALVHAGRLRFKRVCRLDDQAAIRKQTYPGLYFIEIRVDRQLHRTVQEWIEWFRPRWEKDAPRMHFTPGIKAGRVARHTCLKEWMPFYLGIRKTFVAHRVMQHIELSANANTAGLKLKSRKNVKLSDFRLSTIRLELEAYDAIAPRVEWALRNKLSPITGN